MIATEQDARTLLVSWSTSRGRDTDGWNICRLDDTATGKRYRCMGGGYDMTGTVFADWLQDVAQDQLREIADRAHRVYWGTTPGRVGDSDTRDDGFYGMTTYAQDGRVMLDGACGLSSIERIAEAVGVHVRHIVSRRGSVQGFTVTGISS